MADNVLLTRVQLKYDTLANWLISTIILKRGEMAIAEIPSVNTINGQTNLTNPPDNTPPVIGIKIGDGIHRFIALPWIQAIAGDVHEWAKSSTIPSADQIPGLEQYVQDHGSGINGTVTVPQGGTGITNVPENNVLVGNGTNAMTTKPIASTITNQNSDSLVTSGAVQTYITLHFANLASAMHFIGRTQVNIKDHPTYNPTISGYDFTNAQAGDVVLYNTGEYVWDGSKWLLLGEEGSYVLSGQIRNEDIAVNAAIDMSKIAGLTNALSNKVDKETGKGLSTNDYTDTDKAKLDGIVSGAQVNAIEHIKVNGVEQPINNKTVNITISNSGGGQTIISGEGLQYRIVAGTGNEVNKYFLECKAIEDAEWDRESNSNAIDLTSYNNRIGALEAYIYDPDYTSFSDYIFDAIQYKINQLDVNDSAVAHQFVTQVREQDGKVIVSRDTISAENDLTGILTVPHGGTGLETVNAGYALVGNGTNAMVPRLIINSIEQGSNETALVTSAAVQSYISEFLSLINRAMRFVGVVNEDVYITSGSTTDPRISGYRISLAQAGDVIIQRTAHGEQEFVWDGQSWILLGDQDSYIIHGQVMNSDIAANANISISKIDGLETALDNKVSTEYGKSLVANTLISILETVSANAQENVIEEIYVNGVLQQVQDKAVNIIIDGAGIGGHTNGAVIPSAVKPWDETYVNVDTTNDGKLILARMAATGDVADLLQTNNTYIIFDAGSSTRVI